MERRWYRVVDPGTEHYLYRRPVSPTRPIFQGDVFEGVPNVVLKHPSLIGEARRQTNEPQLPLVEPVAFQADAVRQKPTSVKVGMAMVLPHICTYYETQKGDRLRYRTVARVRKISQEKIPDDWDGGFSLFPLPNLLNDGDMYLAQLDLTTTLEDAFLAKRARVACLSFEGWLALQQRLSHYVSRFIAPWDDLDRLARPTWDEAAADESKAQAGQAEPVSEGRRDAP